MLFGKSNAENQKNQKGEDSMFSMERIGVNLMKCRKGCG